MTEQVFMTGLDGSNPGAFLATLGAFDIASRARNDTKLKWVSQGRWRPCIEGIDAETLIECIKSERNHDPYKRVWSYTHAHSPKSDVRVADVKSTPKEWRDFLELALETTAPNRRHEIDLIAALAPEGGEDRSGATKPTALHFTAGQQRFLGLATEINDRLEDKDIEEALFGPWRYERDVKVMGWDVANDRNHALRATDPSTDKKTGIPGADWLGLRGLVFLPCVARDKKTRTPGVKGGWKSGTFTWPIWSPPLCRNTVRSLLSLDMEGFTQAQREAMGIVVSYRARIRRSDQGGYGSFAPPKVLVE